MTIIPSDPEARCAASNADRVWHEFLAALDALAPDARTAFLLHEVFETGYDDIASLIGQPAEACRRHVELAREQAWFRMQAPIVRAKGVSR